MDNRYTIVSLIENEPFSRNIKIFSFDNMDLNRILGSWYWWLIDWKKRNMKINWQKIDEISHPTLIENIKL